MTSTTRRCIERRGRICAADIRGRLVAAVELGPIVDQGTVVPAVTEPRFGGGSTLEFSALTRKGVPCGRSDRYRLESTLRVRRLRPLYTPHRRYPESQRSAGGRASARRQCLRSCRRWASSTTTRKGAPFASWWSASVYSSVGPELLARTRNDSSFFNSARANTKKPIAAIDGHHHHSIGAV